MALVVEEITLDISKVRQFVTVRLQQGDANTRALLINILDDGDIFIIPSGSLISLSMMRSNNTPIYNTCSLEDNKAKITITSAMTEVAGLSSAKIIITDPVSGGELATIPFKIIIEEEVIPEEMIVTTGEFTVLENALLEVAQYKNRALQIGDLTQLLTTSNTDLVSAINENTKSIGYVNVKQFGAIGDGITDDTTAFQAAVDYAIQNRKKLDIDGTFLISDVSVTESLTITGRTGAKLKAVDNHNAINVNYHSNINSTITNITTSVDNIDLTTVYISNANSYKKGDIVKLYSEDVVPTYTNIKTAQFFMVDSVNSNNIVLLGSPRFAFSTNPKLIKIENKNFVLENVTLEANRLNVYADKGVVNIIGGTYHKIINCKLTNVDREGFLFYGCYGYDVSGLIIDRQEVINSDINRTLGMGVADTGSGYFKVSYKTAKSMNPFGTVYSVFPSYPEGYGQSEFGEIFDITSNGSCVASTHNNSYRCSFNNGICNNSDVGIDVRGEEHLYNNFMINVSYIGAYLYRDGIEGSTANKINSTIKNSTINSKKYGVYISENNTVDNIKLSLTNNNIHGTLNSLFLKSCDLYAQDCVFNGKILHYYGKAIFKNCKITGNFEFRNLSELTFINCDIDAATISGSNYITGTVCNFYDCRINLQSYIACDSTTTIYMNNCQCSILDYDYIFYTTTALSVKIENSNVYFKSAGYGAHVIYSNAQSSDTLSLFAKNLSFYNGTARPSKSASGIGTDSSLTSKVINIKGIMIYADSSFGSVKAYSGNCTNVTKVFKYVDGSLIEA